MSQSWAVLLEDTVVNVIVADDNFAMQYAAQTGLKVIGADTAGIGYTWTEQGGFQPPVTPVIDDPNIIDAEIIEPMQAIEAPTTVKK
jgi:hypothetical protein